MKRIVCISLIILVCCISGCNLPTIETWNGFQVASDCDADILSPKMPRPRPAGMQHWFEVHYRTTLY